MAYVSTYNTLTQSVLDYLENQGSALINEIPLFIMLAQRRCARELKILGLKVAITDNLLPGQYAFEKPVRWLNDASFNIAVGNTLSSRVYLLQRGIEFCRSYWPDP